MSKVSSKPLSLAAIVSELEKLGLVKPSPSPAKPPGPPQRTTESPDLVKVLSSDFQEDVRIFVLKLIIHQFLKVQKHIKMEETASASNEKVDVMDDSTIDPGKEIFWSNINEKCAMLATVDLTNETSPPPPGSETKPKGYALENELRDALDMVSELKKENMVLKNHVLSLETTRSSGLNFYL